MGRPRWQKVLRDLWTSRGRLFLMIIAMAASLFALGTSLSSYAILSRELTRAYLATTPASATLETHGVTPEMAKDAQKQPGIAIAEARATLFARVYIEEDWRPLVLFVVPDFTQMRLSSFSYVSGEWPPPSGTMLVDHLALSVAQSKTGDTLLVKTQNGSPKELSISGVVWDSGLAPAPMERAVWGYITPETMALLGETQGLDELKIVTAGSQTKDDIEETAQALAARLQAQGHEVHEIQIPPPGKHPHQGQLWAVMLMLNVFSLFALVLSAILVGSMVASMMARQVKEIGVMKAIGASRGQIASMYLVMLLVLGVGALVLSVPLSVVAARGLAGVAAYNLNIKIESVSIPWWVFLAQLSSGIFAPLFAASVPVVRASRMTVQQALHDAGTTRQTFGEGWFSAWLSRRSAKSPRSSLMLRNAFRHRGRLFLTLGLLSAGGAMLISAMNTAEAWSLRLDEVNTARRYDLSLQLQRPEPIEKIKEVLSSVEGVSRYETLGFEDASWGEGRGVPVISTYPDGGHGAFRVIGLNPQTRLLDLPLMEGRWLQPEDDGVVVLNHSAAGISGAKVGEEVTISTKSGPHRWRVVGIVRDIGSPSVAYISSRSFEAISASPGKAEYLLLSGSDAADRTEMIRRVERAVEGSGMGIAFSVPMVELRNAVSEHMAVLLGLLLGLAGLMTLVGVLGLTASMSTAVIERTRELGVMQAVGASPGLVLRIILGEGLFVGVLGGALAVPLSLPLSLLIGDIVGGLAFRSPLPLVVSFGAVLVWLVLVVVFSALATSVPARRASRMTVREALAYQ